MRIGLWAVNMLAPRCGVTEYVCRVACAVSRARMAGADLLVLPEYASMLMLSSEQKLPETREVRRVAALSALALPQIKKMADSAHVAILAGTAPTRVGKGFRNRATLYLPTRKGIETRTQDKNHLTPSECDPRGWQLEPGYGYTPIQWAGHKLGIAICHDISNDDYAALVEQQMPDIVIVPSNTPKPNHTDGHSWIFNWAKRRSEQWNCVVAAVGSVGNQQLDGRVEPNVGGAAAWRRGDAIGELGAMAETVDPIGPMLVVDI